MGDPGLAREIRLATRAIDNGLTVLIQGETGTGKEVMARELHSCGIRSGGKFIAVNCAAIPESLIESELFGYADGAFTGARRGGAIGRIEEADGGTLFLDEIGDMPIALQSRLLRVLDTREVARLGGGPPRKVNCNVICATHQDLERAIELSAFRADLYYRISGLSVRIKPLRERPELEQLLNTLARSIDDAIPGIDGAALEILTAYSWPGNTRQALNVLRRAALLRPPGSPILREHLPEFPTQMNETVRDGVTLISPAAAHVQHSSESFCVGELETLVLMRALNTTRGNVSKAASLVGLSRSTLQRRLRKNPALRDAR